MPYIKAEERARLGTDGAEIRTSGELNYVFTAIAIYYIDRAGLSYSSINDVLGALEGAKAEFYRRIAVPYEDLKIKENGDVYYEDSAN